jgi:hypothetical protein
VALTVLLLLTVVAGAQTSDAGLATIRADALKGHVFFLAAPEMGGRDSLSPEGRIAANYIAAFFHRLGLKPAGDDGTYFQRFAMTEAQIDREQTHLRATTVKDGSSIVHDYRLAADFTLARQGGVDVDVIAPVVFAGYGIEAELSGFRRYTQGPIVVRVNEESLVNAVLQSAILTKGRRPRRSGSTFSTRSIGSTSGCRI